MAHWVKNLTAASRVAMEAKVWSLVPCSGLKKPVMLQLWHRSQLWLGFNPCPKNFHMLHVWPLRKKKKDLNRILSLDISDRNFRMPKSQSGLLQLKKTCVWIQIYHLSNLRPGFLTSLFLSFSLYKMVIIIVPNSIFLLGLIKTMYKKRISPPCLVNEHYSKHVSFCRTERQGSVLGNRSVREARKPISPVGGILKSELSGERPSWEFRYKISDEFFFSSFFFFFFFFCLSYLIE